jgi:hypothetical protein
MNCPSRWHNQPHCAAVVWDDGDLAIDAVHLKMLAYEQKQGARESS